MSSGPIVRSRVIRAYDARDATSVLGEGGELVRFTGESADLARAILHAVVEPRSREALLAHLGELTGSEVPWTGAVADTIAHLEAAGALRAEETRPTSTRARRRVVLALTGAVAASFAPSLVQNLQARGLEVRVAATRAALRFVGAIALEALTHAPVVASLWPRDPAEPVPHLALARWADVVVVWPASATSIARIAAGSCGTVVAATAIATRAPVLIVPSMNEAMYLAPAVQRNLEQLREDGFLVAHPSCGVEVADAPDRRRLAIGPAPPFPAVADLVDAVLAREVRTPPLRASPPDWDELYRTQPADALPWFTEALDADIAGALDAIVATDRGAGRLLDLGTGTGTAAIAAADRGLSVVATDVAPHAVEIARARAGDRPVLFVVDDIRRTALRGAFDLVLDRGLLHVLGAGDRARWALAVAALTRAGGHVIVKCHVLDEPDDHGTHRFSREELSALLGDAFELVRAADAVFPGPGGRTPKALLAVFRRRAVAA